ncbi:MAG: arylsulfatase [Alphaproteobacteria bacterium]|jgi:Asp/Glu/hydantoin racemase|nr:arylsulfatase [Alphaproteobacteria bacterium]
MSHRIVLIHAVPMAIEPVGDAFKRIWPEAEVVNLLEDSLSHDRAATGHLDRAMMDRFRVLGDYALSIGADGILFTCSAFGPAIEMVARDAPVPVLKPNEAMFDAALDIGARIGMLVTFQGSVASMRDEFQEMAAGRGLEAVIEPCLVEEAMMALRQGDGERHNALLVEAAPTLADCDAVMLAQFSTAQAKDAVAEVLGVPVLTAPDAAVERMKAAVLNH